MGEVRPEEAAQALAEIEQRNEQALRRVNVPDWFWWAEAGLIVGFTAAIESRQPVVIGIGVAAFVVGLVIVIVKIVLGTVRYAQPRNDLIRPAGVLAILGFVALILAITLPTAFALEAAGVRYPATLGTLVAGIMLVVGGPILTRYLHRVMLANVTGGRR
jgi:hypothetical protein